MSRASTNSGSGNVFSEGVGISVFRHSAHIRFLSTTFPFITVMQAYSKVQEAELLVLVGEGINMAQHLGFVMNPHFDSAWGAILGGGVSKAIFTSHLPFYDRLYNNSANVLASFFGLLSTAVVLVLAIILTHIAIGITAAKTDRYSAGLVWFNRIALRSLSTWLWIPLLQVVVAPLVCISTYNNSRGVFEDLVWHFVYYSSSGPEAALRERGQCLGGNQIAFIILAGFVVLAGFPLLFMARWCEYVCRSDSYHLRARRHWYADMADYVHSAVICVLFQVLVAFGYHGAFAAVLTVTSFLMACLYAFFLPYYEHRMNYWYVGVHLLTAVASVLACATYLNDNWYAMMASPVVLLGGLPLIAIGCFMFADWRISPKFLKALQLCAVDGRLASMRFVPHRAMALEDEMIDTIVPLPSPHRHIPHSSTRHRMRFPCGLQDETLAAFAPFDDFDDRVRVAIIGKQSRMYGGGSRRRSTMAREDDEDDVFFSGTAGSYAMGPGSRSGDHSGGSRGQFGLSGGGGDDGEGGDGYEHNGGGGGRGGSRRRLYAKRFSRLLEPYICSVWCPTDVELSISYIGECVRKLHRSPTKAMTLLAMHTFARGIVKYPQSAFLKLQCGGFIAEHLPNFAQFGMALTNSLQLYDNTFADEFRGIQLKQAFRHALSMRSQSDAVHSKNALAQHREVLGNMHRFWGLLMEPTVSIQLVSAEADLITRNRRIALQHFRRAVQHLTLSNWPLIISAGEFLGNVLLDEEGAAECFKEARELHEARMAGQMKGSRMVTVVMPDVETLSQRLLSLLTMRRGGITDGGGTASAASRGGGVVQYLMAFLTCAFIVLLLVGGAFVAIAVDERDNQKQMLARVADIGAARAAAVQFSSLVYAVEHGTLSERLAAVPALKELSIVFGKGVRTMASTKSLESAASEESLFDHPSIPWSFTPIAAYYLPFDGSARTMTNSQGAANGGTALGSSGGSSLRALMEAVQSSMQSIILNNATNAANTAAATARGAGTITSASSSGGSLVRDGPLNSMVDTDMLFLREASGVLGVSLTYQIDVLQRVQSGRLRERLITLILVFVVGICTLALIRAIVYVSLRRSSLERVFTFQLMTLIPFDALERLSTETKEKKESIRRLQGGGGGMAGAMERRLSGDATLGSGHGGVAPTGAPSLSPSSPSGGVLPSLGGDAFGPPSASPSPQSPSPSAVVDPILASLERSMRQQKANGNGGATMASGGEGSSGASASASLGSGGTSSHASGSAGTMAGSGGGSYGPASPLHYHQQQQTLGGGVVAAAPHFAAPVAFSQPSSYSTAYASSLAANGGVVQPISTTIRSARSAAQQQAQQRDGADDGQRVKITVLPSKAPQPMVPLRSALKSSRIRSGGGSGVPNTAAAVGSASTPTSSSGAAAAAAAALQAAAAQQRRGVGLGQVAVVGPVTVHHGTGQAAVKRVTFAVPTRRVRQTNGDSSRIYSSLSGRRIVSGATGRGGAGGGGSGMGIGLFSAEDGHVDSGGYVGVSAERTSMLRHQRGGGSSGGGGLSSSSSSPSSDGSSTVASARRGGGFFHIGRRVRRYFGSISTAALVGALIASCVLFVAGTVAVGLALERSMFIPDVESTIREEADLFYNTNKSWVAEDAAGAQFIGLGIAEGLSTFLSHSTAVTSSIPMYANLRLNDGAMTHMGHAAVNSKRTSANYFTGNGDGGGSSSPSSSAGGAHLGALGHGPRTSDAVGLMVQVDRAHTAQMDAKRDALALAAIGHGVAVDRFPLIESRRVDPMLTRRVWDRQREVYEHAQVLFASSFLSSSRGKAPDPIEKVRAQSSSSSSGDGGSASSHGASTTTTTIPKAATVVTNETTYADIVRITSPTAASGAYAMPADFVLLLAGMAYADTCGYAVDSRKILTRVYDGRMAATESRMTAQAPRPMLIASMLCFSCGIVVVLFAALFPVSQWTAYTLNRYHLFILCLLAAVPLVLAAVTIGNTNLSRRFTEDHARAMGVLQDAQSVFTNTLYQHLYVISSLSRFWSLYDGCRCHIYGTVIRLTLRDEDRESYISQNGATDLFSAARVIKSLQNIANSLTTTTIIRHPATDIVPTTGLPTSVSLDPTGAGVSDGIAADFYSEYDSYQSALGGLDMESSRAVQRELNRSLESLFWDVEAEVGRATFASYFPEEINTNDPWCYYTNSTFDLERRSATAQRQLAIKVTFGDRYAKALQRMEHVTDGASHRALSDLESRTAAHHRYSFALIIATLSTCVLPIMGTAFILLRLVGTAYSLLGLEARSGGGSSSNKLDSSSSQIVATRTQWSLVMIALMLAIPFSIGVWTLARDGGIFSKGVRIKAFEYERLKSLQAIRELTASGDAVVMGLHDVDHSKEGVRVSEPDIGVYTVALQSSLRDFLFGGMGDSVFYTLGSDAALDETLMGAADVDAAHAMSSELTRDTCDTILNTAAAARVTTMARLVSAVVGSGGMTSTTLETLSTLYEQYGFTVNSTVLLHLYYQWVEHLAIADMAAKSMARSADRTAALQRALTALEILDASIKAGHATADDVLRSHFEGIIDQGFTLVIVFTVLFLVIVTVVYLFVIIPLVRNLLDEAENARLLLRMIPGAVREKVPAIVQYIDTGRINNAAELQKKFDASEKLLQNILPSNIAARLKVGEVPIADMHPSLTILFTDLVGFTKRSTTMPAAEIVDFLNEIFQQFDTVVELLELEKIKTIGDAYFMAGGLDRRVADHELRVVEAGIMFLRALEEHNEGHPSRVPLQMRLGIHTGPAVAGVIGTRKVAYELWGDSVGIANAMESTGVPGLVHISQTTADKVEDYFILQPRGPLPREKEHIPDDMPNTYLVVGRRVPTPYQHFIRPRLSRSELV